MGQRVNKDLVLQGLLLNKTTKTKQNKKKMHNKIDQDQAAPICELPYLGQLCLHLCRNAYIWRKA